MQLQLFVRVPEINLSLEEYLPTTGSHELSRSIPQLDKQEDLITYPSPSNSQLWKLLKTVAKRQRDCCLHIRTRVGFGKL